MRAAQRDADYAYRLAVDPPASKELRLFGLAGWTIDRFIARRTRLHELQYAATRLRERPVIWSLLLVVSANVIVFWMLASAVAHGRISLGEAVVYVQSAVGVSMIAFGGFSWALDGSAAPVAAVLRLEPAMRPAGALRLRESPRGWRLPGKEIRLRDVSFAYPAVNGAGAVAGAGALRSHHPRRVVAGHRGPERRRQDHHRQAAVPVVRSAVGSDHHRRHRPAGVRSRLLALAAHRRVPGLPPPGAAAARERGPGRSARRGGAAPRSSRRVPPTWPRSTPSWPADTPGGTDLSGGQWQRVALARALAAVSLGAGVVLLDEPTAQLDVRGEAEIFDRLLAATRHCTTILISHRFSTVRHADRICVLEHGRVVELGTHDELMALGGRYRTMFDLQAQRFHLPEEEGATL